jgi:thymidine phosphorylase
VTATGILFLVVGQSGVGKDTLLKGARARLAGSRDFIFAKRVITRPAAAGGEDHEAVSAEEFARRKARGAYLFSWLAHGLEYGLPVQLADELANGRHVVANGSRETIEALTARVPRLVVIEVTAEREIVAERLRGRGRERAEAIAERITRATPPIPATVKTIKIANDADVATGTERLLAALTSSAAVHLSTEHAARA